MMERLQKILSARGIASRRKAEEYLERGFVTVNGEVAKLGQKADPETDTIEVDGKVLEERAQLLYFLLNKPVGIETSNVEGREVQTVRDILPPHLRGHIFPVGRLDKDSEGLLIMTNDGTLAYRLTHPGFEHEKEYFVTVDQSIKPAQLDKLRSGLKIDGQLLKDAVVKKIGEQSFTIALTEGKNRQIRRMCKKVGLEVVRLRRSRIVTLRDDELEAGHLRSLSVEEVQQLRRALDLQHPTT